MRLAERRRLLDVPNERSSHDRPVPRGGGVAIVLTFMAGAVIAGFYGFLDARMLAVVLGGGGLVALVGAVDDFRDVPAGWRLVLHMLVAGWALYWLDGIPNELIPGAPPMLLNAVGLLCIVWLINLYNFMDGIDAIASIETMSVCLGRLLQSFSQASQGFCTGIIRRRASSLAMQAAVSSDS
jgi:Fuc2NAc and GlcNAc transferase